MEGRSKKDLNNEFYSYYLESSLPSMRYGLGFTAILFVVFALIASLFFPENAETRYYLRFGIVVPFLLLSIIVMYIKPLRKHLNQVYIIINILMCISIFLVGITSSPGQKGYEFYYAWVMLTIVGFFIFYRLSLPTLVIIGSLQVTAYILATVLNGTLSFDRTLFINNLFFVVSISSLGFFLAYLIQSLNRKNFNHQKVLTENNEKLQSEIREKLLAEENHQRVAKQYEDTLDSIPDWIFVVDENKKFVILNTALRVAHLRQGLATDCIGKQISDIYPQIPVKLLNDIEEIFITGSIRITELDFVIKGKTIHSEIRLVPVFKDHKVVQAIVIIRDRSKEKEVEELKLRNAEQKEVMLREIHHRVKNNLAIVISLLNLQAEKYPDKELQQIMKDIELRIRSMVLIHEHLYNSDDLDIVPLDKYLHNLASIVVNTFSGKTIDLQYRMDPVKIAIGTALPLGLITNELLTNSLKYAFPGSKQGLITIRLNKDENDFCTLTVSDNGIGLQDDFNLNQQKSMGMFIIRILIEQIEGTVHYNGKGGTSFSIRFKNITGKK